MNAKNTVPLITTLGPALASAAPPVLAAAAVGRALRWLFPDDKEESRDATPTDADAPRPSVAAASPRSTVAARPRRLPPLQGRRVAWEDLAAVFGHCARSLTRLEAVTALKARGFGKTAAYKALSPGSRFAAWLGFSPDGVIDWKG